MVKYSQKWDDNCSWLGQREFADTIKEPESEVFGSQGRGVFPRPALVCHDPTCGLGAPLMGTRIRAPISKGAM